MGDALVFAADSYHCSVGSKPAQGLIRKITFFFGFERISPTAELDNTCSCARTSVDEHDRLWSNQFDVKKATRSCLERFGGCDPGKGMLCAAPETTCPTPDPNPILSITTLTAGPF